MKAILLRVLLISGLVFGAGTMVGCDDDDWEDFFDEAGDFVDDVRCDDGCHHDCYGCDDGFWFDFWAW